MYIFCAITYVIGNFVVLLSILVVLAIEEF